MFTLTLSNTAAKKNEQKLKDSSDASDDYVDYDDQTSLDSFWDDDYWEGDDFWGNDPWATDEPDESLLPTDAPAGAQEPSVTPSMSPVALESRMGTTPEDGALGVDIETTQAFEEIPVDGMGEVLGEIDSQMNPTTSVGSPKVHRELFPDPVELKAHSSVHLREHDAEFFDETTNVLTPCLRTAYDEHLEAYKLDVEYSDGPIATDQGVVVTHMKIHVVLAIVTDTIGALKSLTHEDASQVLHDCFDGPQLYEFLGSLRQEGVEINEIQFQDRPFKSPIFGDGEPSGIISNGGNSSSTSEPKKSRAGLVATLTVGLLVVGAVLLAHGRGKLPAAHIPTDRIGHFAKSIRQGLGAKLGGASQALRERLSSSFSSEKEVSGLSVSSLGGSEGGSTRTPTRERTWSDAFRRHPPVGIKAAALQKKGAVSSDYLKTPRSDDNSYSVPGDYDVTDEYGFDATPVSSVSAQSFIASKRVQASFSKNSSALSSFSKNSSKTESEFGIPDDYHTVLEENSLYSHNRSVMIGGGERRAYVHTHEAVRTPSSVNQSAQSRVTPPLQSTPGNSDVMSRSGGSHYGYSDEWSMNSFQTSSPSGPSVPNGATEIATDEDSSSPPPYRHWGEKPKPSPSSRLAMPKLSFL